MADTDSERKQEPEESPADAGLSVIEAQEQLGHLVLRANMAGERIVVTRYGKATAAIVGMADLRRLRALDCAPPNERVA